MATQVTKTGICDSCGNDKVLYAVAHHQANNPQLFWYCDVCKFAHEKEKRVQAALAALASRNPQAAEDPVVVSQLHEEAATQILTEKAEQETLPPNEQLVDTGVVEGEVVESSTPSTK